MYRYLLEVYVDPCKIFSMEFKSITSVAKTIDRFCNVKEMDIWFDLIDLYKDRNISVEALMQIWHS